MYGLQVFNRKHNKEELNLKPEKEIILSFDKKLEDISKHIIDSVNSKNENNNSNEKIEMTLEIKKLQSELRKKDIINFNLKDQIKQKDDIGLKIKQKNEIMLMVESIKNDLIQRKDTLISLEDLDLRFENLFKNLKNNLSSSNCSTNENLSSTIHDLSLEIKNLKHEIDLKDNLSDKILEKSEIVEKCIPFISSPYGLKHNYCNHVNGKIISFEIDVISSVVNYIGDRIIFPYGTLILDNNINEITFKVEKVDSSIEIRTCKFLSTHNKIKLFITSLTDIKRIFI